MSEEKQPGRLLLDRRTLLRSGAAAALAAPLGVIGAQALPFRAAAPVIDFSEFPICRTASDTPPIAQTRSSAVIASDIRASSRLGPADQVSDAGS